MKLKQQKWTSDSPRISRGQQYYGKHKNSTIKKPALWVTLFSIGFATTKT